MTIRGEKRAGRAVDRAMRRERRQRVERDREAMVPWRPDSLPAGMSVRWTPVPETDYEVNQFGNVRKKGDV